MSSWPLPLGSFEKTEFRTLELSRALKGYISLSCHSAQAERLSLIVKLPCLGALDLTASFYMSCVLFFILGVRLHLSF